jgi:arabinan endo-1,5-alpha-L-arabinosidase
MNTRLNKKHLFREQQMNMQIRNNGWKKTAALATLSLAAITVGLTSCSSGTTNGFPASPAPSTNPLALYQMQGAVTPVHDPTIIRSNDMYYVLSTDPAPLAGQVQVDNLPISCSSDKITWTSCGHVFNTIPSWITTLNPGVTSLWAPDVSYFNGVYHVYYAASTFGTQTSLIGLATAPTMAGPWTDSGGPILQSTSGSAYNAIDPNILIDYGTGTTVQHVWLSYGSFYGGIYQREINPATGTLLTTNTTNYHLASQPGVTGNPIEGASLVQKNGFYYLFVSLGSCCNTTFTTDTYEIAVGRGTSPNGPFVDENGTAMLDAGGTVILATSGEFTAPGGEFVYTDATNGDLITFHGLSNNQNGLDYLFVNQLTWPNNWPLIGTTP